MSEVIREYDPDDGWVKVEYIDAHDEAENKEHQPYPNEWKYKRVRLLSNGFVEAIGRKKWIEDGAAPDDVKEVFPRERINVIYT